MRNLIKTGVILLIVCFATTFFLALVNNITKDIIVARAESDAKEQRMHVMPEAEDFKELTDFQDENEESIVKEAFEAYKGEELVGYVFGAYPYGYGGQFKVTVGIAKDMTIQGVSLGENNETPGLGSKAGDEKFYGQFIGKDVSNGFEIVKSPPSKDNQIQAISGATVTSEAYMKAVQESAEFAERLAGSGGSK
jgi:electron transport complex protein RnfG